MLTVERSTEVRERLPFARLGWRAGIAALLALGGLAPAVQPAHAQSGEAVFKRNCAICHSDDPGKNRVGPTLFGVVGRKAGTVPGYSYSKANKDSGVTWTEENLDTYLTNPQKFIPGTKMAFAGLKDPEQRKALIAYLKEHH